MLSSAGDNPHLRSHRSATHGDLLIQRTRTKTLGPRSFAVSSSTACNSLPPELRKNSVYLQTFKSKLKSHMSPIIVIPIIGDIMHVNKKKQQMFDKLSSAIKSELTKMLKRTFDIIMQINNIEHSILFILLCRNISFIIIHLCWLNMWKMYIENCTSTPVMDNIIIIIIIDLIMSI